jgi:hypothetical protein
MRAFLNSVKSREFWILIVKGFRIWEGGEERGGMGGVDRVEDTTVV